jgi:hypothetical protein
MGVSLRGRWVSNLLHGSSGGDVVAHLEKTCFLALSGFEPPAPIFSGFSLLL